MSLNSFELLGIPIKLVPKSEITHEYHLYINLCYISPNIKEGENFLFKKECFTLSNSLGQVPPTEGWKEGWIQLFTESKNNTQFF